MKSGINISIPKPCGENWHAMLPEEQGRHCLACNKLITDFSRKTDQQILDCIKANNGKVCGRFNQSQLDRNLVSNEQYSHSMWHKVAASLLLFIGINEANAKNIVINTPVISIVESKGDTNRNIHRERSIAKVDSITIRGKVVDEHTNETLPFTVIISEKNKIHMMTDFDGNFSFIIPNDIISIDFEVRIIGYETSFVSVNLSKYKNLKSTEQNAEIVLKITSMQRVVMGDMVYVPRKWYQFWK